MRWFFLLCLFVFAVIGNLAIFEKLNVSRLIGGFCFNVSVTALFGFWWAVYRANVFKKDRTIALSASALLFASGIGLALHAIPLISTNECPQVSHRDRFLSWLLRYAVEAGFCQEVLFVYLALSGFLLFLSLRVLASTRPHI